MDRRSGNFNGASGSEDDLVARSRAWMNRSERKDHWRRSVDDFLDEGFKHKVRDRSPRDRSREDFRRVSSPDMRERMMRRGRKKSDEEDEPGEYRRSDSGSGWSDRSSRNSPSMRERPDWPTRRGDSKRSRDDYDNHDRRWCVVDSWSADDDTNSNCDRSDCDFDLSKFYGSDRREDRYTYKKQVPQKTIIIRGLAQHITEADIRCDIMSSGIQFHDIRLVRRKDTGASRGFAFVEFYDVADATKWIEMKQGELMLKDHFRALLQYSLPRYETTANDRLMADWRCKCSAHNFRRRDTCFRCNLTRKEGEMFDETDEISTHPTNTVLLMGLDALTTEDSVLKSIKYLSSLPIRSVRIGRDHWTNASKGVCYLEMNSVVDANYLYYSLSRSPLIIDNKNVGVHYAKLDPIAMQYSASVSGQMATAAVAAAQWSHQKPMGSGSSNSQYTLADVPRLAEYSASLYATNAQEKASYLTYYEDYYKKQISEGNQIALPNNASDTAAPGWAGAQAAYAATQGKSSGSTTPGTNDPPDGSGSKTYLVPDVSSYQFDQSSGYYYDPSTGLYYDANSQYYYNTKLQKFLYWDAAKKTYLPAPTSQQSGKPGDSENDKDDDKKKEKENEKDKVKVAKRIAKDMEKWAKTLNQKKEIAKQNIVAAQQAMVANMRAQGSADIGYAVLERKELSAAPVPPAGTPLMFNNEPKPSNSSLVAAYSDSEEEQGDESSVFDEKQHIDLSKIACLLCKRQFSNKDILMKHVQMSDLHKQNLSAWYKARGIDIEDPSAKKQYRDRAKERRQKYGEPDAPHPNRLKETYIKAREAVNYEEPTKAGIGADNLGNKLLQKMGWQEGMGLGKSNQGRTNIIQAQRRSATAGLGTKSTGVTPGPGETYKDCVKRMMVIRYNDLDQEK